jgi:hypothetical protein
VLESDTQPSDLGLPNPCPPKTVAAPAEKPVPPLSEEEVKKLARAPCLPRRMENQCALLLQPLGDLEGEGLQGEMNTGRMNTQVPQPEQLSKDRHPFVTPKLPLAKTTGAGRLIRCCWL